METRVAKLLPSAQIMSDDTEMFEELNDKNSL